MTKPFTRVEGTRIVDVVVGLRGHARSCDALEGEGHLRSCAAGDGSPTKKDDGIAAKDRFDFGCAAVG